jgi:hypothetical protein
MSSPPFRFLELPPEFRDMVYERISPTTHKHILSTQDASGAPTCITLIRQSLPVALLSTCRQIKHEAQPSFDDKYAALKNEPMRFVVNDAASALALVRDNSLLVKCFGLSLRRDLFQTRRRRAQRARKEQDYEMAELHETRICEVELEVAAMESSAKDDVKAFIARNAAMLAWVRQVKQTPQRRFDVEFHIKNDIASWDVNEMTEFLTRARIVCYEAGVAGIVIGHGVDHVYPGFRVRTASDIWRAATIHATDLSMMWTAKEQRRWFVLVEVPGSSNAAE